MPSAATDLCSDEARRPAHALAGFVECLRGRWVMVVSYALYCMWTWIVFFGYAPNVSIVAQAAGSTWLVPSGGVAVTFLLFAVLRKACGIVPHGKAYRLCWCLLTVFGNAMVVLQFMGVVAWPPLVEVAFLAIVGAGGACMHLEYERVFGSWGAKATLAAGVASVFLGACLLFVLELLPNEVCRTYIVVFPPIALAIFDSQEPHRLWKADQKACDLHIPWRLVGTMLLQGLSFGVMQSVILGTEAGVGSPLLAVASFGVAAVAMLVTGVFCKMDFNQLFYQVGLPLMALGYVAMPLSGLFGMFFHSMGYRFTAILCWVLCAYLVQQKEASVTWVFSWAIASLLAGELTGAIAAMVLRALWGISVQTASTASLIMVFALLMGSLVMFDRRNLTTGWGLFRPTEGERRPDAVQLGCDLLGRERGLTARETEVLALLARGHTKAEVAELLSLSRETVKVHGRSIYAKLDVHTQRELASMVEARAQGFARESGEPLALTAF